MSGFGTFARWFLAAVAVVALVVMATSSVMAYREEQRQACLQDVQAEISIYATYEQLGGGLKGPSTGYVPPKRYLHPKRLFTSLDQTRAACS